MFLDEFISTIFLKKSSSSNLVEETLEIKLRKLTSESNNTDEYESNIMDTSINFFVIIISQYKSLECCLHYE